MMRAVRVAVEIGLLLGMVGGCAVLNQAQVGAVQQFAQATSDYGTLPGSVVTAYAGIRSTNNVLLLEATPYGTTEKANDALSLMRSNIAETTKSLDTAAQIDDALRILADYAGQLTALASDRYTTQIETSAQHLGQQIDGGVAAYNKQFSQSISSPGATVAAVVRGLGDWYVKVQQTRMLKRHVRAADPLVQTLTADVEGILARFVGGPPLPAGVPGWLPDERDVLERLFKVAASRHTPGPDYIARVSSADARIDTASSLAASAISSARGYRAAHAKLLAALDDESVLATLRDDVAAVRAEVDATRKFEARLEEQRQQ